MPIKPENKQLYPPPKEWKLIRAEVLKRDENRCAHCGVNNQAVGYRTEDGIFHDLTGCVDPRADGLLRIVLTIAHLDHNPRNNGQLGARPNLAALCQRCHLRYDQAHHMENSRKTRNVKKGQEVLL
jgi:5-methylcytosine-specific restriction endonuclease McrA